MTNKDLLALIKAKYNIVSTADEDLLSEIAKTQRSIYSRIKALVDKLPQANGRFIWDSKSTQINQITKTVFDSIRNSTYRNKVDAYLRKFDQIEGMNKTIIGETSGISARALRSLDLSDEKKQAIGAITKRLTSPDSIESNITQPISQILYKHARFGATVDEAVNALNEFITNTDASEGIISRYVGQIGRDAINGYNGTLYAVMAREYELNAYRYVGGLVKDSRPQCITWINHDDGVLTREYLEPLLEEATQLILSGDKSENFKGYSKYSLPLNWETFAIIRGGHNCLHEAIPFKMGEGKQFPQEGITSEETGDENTVATEEGLALASDKTIDTNTLYLTSSGNYVKERTILHKKIESDILESVSKSDDPPNKVFYMVGGAPANGKSTFLTSTKSRIPKKILEINSDLIKEALPEYNDLINAGNSNAAKVVHEESSYLSKLITGRAISQGRPVLLDSVGDGSIQSMQRKINGYRAGGHRISADYVTLDTDLSLKLAQSRAEKTGRYVPIEYIKDMNREISRMLPKYLERGFFDELRLWDTNKNGVPRLIFKYKDGVSTIVDEVLYERFLSKGR